MSGSPTEAEVQTQWRAAVNMLESLRNYADGTVAGGGNLIQTLYDSLEGEYTPPGLVAWADSCSGGPRGGGDDRSAKSKCASVDLQTVRPRKLGAAVIDVDFQCGKPIGRSCLGKPVVRFAGATNQFTDIDLGKSKGCGRG